MHYYPNLLITRGFLKQCESTSSSRQCTAYRHVILMSCVLSPIHIRNKTFKAEQKHK